MRDAELDLILFSTIGLVGRLVARQLYARFHGNGATTLRRAPAGRDHARPEQAVDGCLKDVRH